MGLKDDILGFDDRVTASVVIPEWKNNTITIRAFSGAELDAWQQYCNGFHKRSQPIPNLRAKLATLIVVDDEGNQVFSDADVEVLGKKSGKALDRIFDAWIKLNKVSEEEAAEYEKNS